MSVQRVRLLAGVLSALMVGCAVDGCDWSTQRPAPASETTEAATEAAAEPEDTEGSAPAAGALPVLSEAALQARLAAQTRLLGRKALFEDASGKPVPALAVDPEADTEIEDDILDALPGSSGINVLEDETETRANGNALGLYVPLEHPKQPALAGFHAALRELAAGNDEDGKLRIAVYGASHTQADIYPEYIRSYLQSRFGNGGVGFVPLVKINRWHRPFHVSLDSGKHWTVEHAQRRDGRDDGLFGLLGASASTSKRREYTKVSRRTSDDETPNDSRFEIFYLAQPGGGKFSVKLDGKSKGTVNTSAKSVKAGYHALTAAPGAHEVEIRHAGGGEVRLFGMTIENESPGVVVDTLGISGTRASNQLKWDQPVWADNMRRRAPDLFMLAFGTNESTDEDQPIERYRRQLVEVLEQFRAAIPQASCLLIGPGDSLREAEEGVWVRRPRLAQIVEVQRDVAWEHGCAFWDGVAFMGGEGSSHTWATSKPQMASRDHIHLTRRGYVRMGMAITDAIMAEFDDAP